MYESNNLDPISEDDDDILSPTLPNDVVIKTGWSIRKRKTPIIKKRDFLFPDTYWLGDNGFIFPNENNIFDTDCLDKMFIRIDPDLFDKENKADEVTDLNWSAENHNET